MSYRIGKFIEIENRLVVDQSREMELDGSREPCSRMEDFFGSKENILIDCGDRCTAPYLLEAHH